jgi:hypothetical protein
MELELIRKYHPQGTNGTIAYNGQTICATIELPWKNNSARISCIPEGRYSLIKRYSPHFRSHFMLQDVPGRSYILIHPANYALVELKGCIAPVSLITGIGEGIYSVKAMQKIISLLAPAYDRKELIFITIKK